MDKKENPSQDNKTVEFPIDSKTRNAQKMFSTLCATLEDMHWVYQKDEDLMRVEIKAIGSGTEILLFVTVVKDRQLMYLKSPLLFKIPEERIDVMSTALHAVNYSMLTGCFEYDMFSGHAGFKMVVPFADSDISQEVCKFMIMLSCQTMDQYNDKLSALSKGETTLSEFLAKLNS